MQQVCTKQIPINVTGMLLPFNPQTMRPALVALEGVLFLPLFSTQEKLILGMEIIGLACIIQQIIDPEEFVESVRGQVRIMVDPWVTEEGNTRFLEIENT